MSGKRWVRFWLLVAATSLIFTLLSVGFIQELMVTPKLAVLDSKTNPERALLALINSDQPRPGMSPPPWLEKPHRAVRSPAPSSDLEVRAAFYINQDQSSLHSLKEQAEHLSHIIPEAFSLGDMPPRLVVAPPDAERDEVLKNSGIKSIALLDNHLDGDWQPESVETLLRDNPESQRLFAEELASRLGMGGHAGVLIDWQQIDPVYRPQYSALMSVIAQVLHRNELELWLAVPVGLEVKLLDLEALASTVDHFLAMLYYENGEDDPAGSLASQTWFNEWLQALLAYGTPGQWVIGIGNFGYDWPEKGKPETIGFLDAMARAQSQPGTTVSTRAPLYNPHFSYHDRGEDHQVWFLDAISFRNQAELARQFGVAGIALYRLGTEDPQALQSLNPSQPPDSLAVLESSERFTHIGKGDFLWVEKSHAPGQRRVLADDAHLWSADYVRFPDLPTVYHSGMGAPDMVALTFDDGPDPDWTPTVLDILKEKGVKAAFFVVGAKAALHPDLVKRMVDEGHELAVHTYTHPNLTLVSTQRLNLELNATQHLLESVTGRSTLLFRPPYNADRRPSSIAEVEPLLEVQKMGYVTVTQSIDTTDWELPGADEMLRQVKSGRSESQEGNVILMHDAGGDREQTLEALPQIIDYLHNRGDRIVSLAELVGSNRDALMPPAKTEEKWLTRTGFDVIRFLEQFFWAFMILSTFLVLARTLVVLWLALRQQQRLRVNPFPPLQEAPALSVLIAAYNEAKVIEATLNSVLNTQYPGELELVVVDDGSQDGSAELIAAMAATDARIRLIRQPNRGKARALQNALEHSHHETLVMLDADTQFQPDTLLELVRALQLPEVGAVSGHVKVGNRRSLLGKFQALEYTCGFNLDRRAYDEWDCITVVPGAACAMRRSAITAAGGLSDDTLAEDTDLTLALHRAGFKVRYSPEAIAWTEAPDSIRALAKQRVRWSFGTLQCLWKHRDMLFNPAFGALAFFSLPSIALFQMFLVAVIPLVDALLVLSLVWGFGMAIINYAVVFLLVDLLLAILACFMEKESVWQAGYILLMRLLYRPLLAYAVWASLLRMLRGKWGGWSKLERRGTVLANKDAS